MLVSLYTVRVVLETLGAEDYGIYTTVAGVVTMLNFLSGAMASSSQRFFAFEIGRKNFDRLKQIFSLNIIIYIIIAFLILLFSETLGLWFVNNKLIIPSERKIAALWVYHFSVFSFLFTILTTPFMAAIIAHEDMRIYAYISIIEAILRLGLVFVLKLLTYDKLKLYGLLMCLVSCINVTLYCVVSNLKYEETKYKFYWNFGIFKELISYNGWHMFGWTIVAVKYQAMNILLNQFFSPVVVAARAISLSVNSAVTSFRNGFTAAIKPRIIKDYAGGQKHEVSFFLFFGTKIICFLFYVVALPLFLEIYFVLLLWLENPPEYTGIFIRLILIDMLVNSFGASILETIITASGKIKLYTMLTRSILLLNLPLAWIAMKNGMQPYIVTIIAIGLSVVSLLATILITKTIFNFSVVKFFLNVLLSSFFAFTLAAVAPLILHIIFKESIWRLLVVSAVSVVSVCCATYGIALNKPEKEMIKNMVIKKTIEIFSTKLIIHDGDSSGYKE
jgi:O-antigen/teichoic acid export membrane protein